MLHPRQLVVLVSIVELADLLTNSVILTIPTNNEKEEEKATKKAMKKKTIMMMASFHLCGLS